MDCSTDKNKLQIITKVPFLHNTFSSISHFGLPQVFRPNSPEMEKLCTSPFLTKMPPGLPRLSLQLYQKISCQVHKVLMPEDTLPPPMGLALKPQIPQITQKKRYQKEKGRTFHHISKPMQHLPCLPLQWRNASSIS